MRSVTVSLSKLKSYCDDILIKVGIPEQEAEIITDSLFYVCLLTRKED
jgi:LDH2 family malate/lactate/ureidoglycolate dehydrogenase